MIDKKEIDKAIAQLTKKVNETKVFIGDRQPNYTVDGRYVYHDRSFWTKGFWAGVLWNLYLGNDEKDESLRELALKCEKKLDETLDDYYILNHDNGFVFNLTSIINYKVSGDEESKRRAIKAASHLAGRFNIKGNFIRAWNPNTMGGNNEGWAIIDCLMNLPLLHWASKELNCPRFKHIAIAHADTVLKHFIRENGSSAHITCFDPETGEHLGYNKGQGYAPDSAWSRGTSWALYGMTLSYIWTNEERYLSSARKTAEFWMSKTKENLVPRWDFDAPDDMSATDASAACCAACGLLELSKHVDKEEGKKYYEWAYETLMFINKNYTTYDTNAEGIVTGCTLNHNSGMGVNCSLIYGDYFFSEGLFRLKDNKNIFW